MSTTSVTRTRKRTPNAKIVRCTRCDAPRLLACDAPRLLARDALCDAPRLLACDALRDAPRLLARDALRDALCGALRYSGQEPAGIRSR